MINKLEEHSFHIPVLGIGYSIDTPAKVAQLGISSVISLVDDMLMEKMREFYCDKFEKPFQAITNKIDDFRAKRITAYLDLMDEMVQDKVNELKSSFLKKSFELEKYIDVLPDSSLVKSKFKQFIAENKHDEACEFVCNNMPVGSIDVNIMTKLDKDNYIGDEKLPVEYNDAHAALRGFAMSKVKSSVVLSAGMNPRLFSYFEQFDAFLPNAEGDLDKKIILKVSDYRSALVQGKMLAKKGLWVSEYRIESGLNCGGHAFASQGFLMGPVLEEFKNNRQELIDATHELMVQALEGKNKVVPQKPLQMKITAQGGVGNSEEHDFLIKEYNLDSVGWGTPFLLVPEASSIDAETVGLLSKAKEEDLYLSNVSPLGIPINNLRTNTKDIERAKFIKEGKPGTPCVKYYGAINKEFTDKVICTSSRQYQKMKLEELDQKGLDGEAYKKEFNKIVDKSCICVGLGTATLKANNLDTHSEGNGVSVCPGPNVAYFNNSFSLKQMVDHIYGRTNLIEGVDRPHVFVKELKLYVDFLKNKLDESIQPLAGKELNYLKKNQKNVDEGIQYYKGKFSGIKMKCDDFKNKMSDELDNLHQKLKNIELKA